MQAAEMQWNAAPTFAEMVAAASTALAGAGVSTPRLDAEVLLARVCGLERTALYTRGPLPVPPQAAALFQELLARRLRREPLAYILGRREFWSLDFEVTPEVLVPRPETERLVEITVDCLRGRRGDAVCGKICEIGTGSGCVAVALAHELPEVSLCAVDISPAALEVAAGNAARHGVASRIRFVCGDLFDAGGETFDAVVANPPYVASAELAGAQPELAYEPRVALDGGRDGLDLVRRLVAAAPGRLTDGGWLIVEIGADQGAAALAAARQAGWTQIDVRADYAGRTRVLVARK